MTLSETLRHPAFPYLIAGTVLTLAWAVTFGPLSTPPVEQPQPVGPYPVPPGESPFPTGQEGNRFPGQDRPPAEAPRPTIH